VPTREGVGVEKYDIVLERLLSKCRETFLEYFLDLDLEDVEILEIHQETTSLRRADFPLKVRSKTSGTFIVLLEVQTKWHKNVPLRLLEYEVRYRIQTGMNVLPLVMVLTRSPGVVDYYETENIHYKFKVIKLWELDAKKVLQGEYVCLAPFSILMKDGRLLYEKADRLIVDSGLDRETKGTLLTAMTLLGGLVDEELPKKLLEMRRDIMRESIAYDLIKEEGLKEGLQQGLEKGLQQGLEKGLQQGLQP
jgi:predicted transposase YdaD